MKRIITLILTTITFTTFAQLEVKETQSSEIWKDGKGQSITQVNLSYGYFYVDAQYEYIIEMDYIILSNIEELRQFIDLCIQAIEENKEFDTDKYNIRPRKKTVTVFANGGYFYVSIKNLNEIKVLLNK